MKKDLKLLTASSEDISELYDLQKTAFESEAEMIGSRNIPALRETKQESKNDFVNWKVLKLINTSNAIVGAIRYKKHNGKIEVGRVMVHPDYRKQGLAQWLLQEVDKEHPYDVKELYTCTKSWININLYKKMGYKVHHEVCQDDGLTYVYMRKYSSK